MAKEFSDMNLEKLALEWVKLNYKYNKIFSPREVDCIVSKTFNSVDFYFVNEIDEQWYIQYKKNNYKDWCKNNYNLLVENKKIDPTVISNWKELFNKRKIYPLFIGELFVTSKMSEQMLAGKNLKRIK